MAFAARFVACIILTSFATALPTQQTPRSVSQVAIPGPSRHGATSLVKTHLKYGVTPATHVLDAAVSGSTPSKQNGSVTDYSVSSDTYYVVPVTIGNPGQTLYLNFDTGSSDLWVFSNFLDSEDTQSHQTYNFLDDESVELQSGSWNVTYGDGTSASGFVVKSVVTVGSVIVEDQAVELATQISSAFVNDISDGLLGLAFDSINTVKPDQQTTFWSSGSDSFLEPVFTALLKHNEPGLYTFGSIDTSQYTGDITYADVEGSYGFWNITVDGYTVGSGSSSEAFSAIVDTGTTLLVLPKDVVADYYSNVDGAYYSDSAAGWIIPAGSVSSLPSLSLSIGGVLQTVPGDYLTYSENGDGSYYGALQAGSGINILGDVFLKSVFAVFDFGNLRVGFAQQASS